MEAALLIGKISPEPRANHDLRRSFGLMAHYEYDLAALDARAQAYADSGEPGVRAGARDALA